MPERFYKCEDCGRKHSTREMSCPGCHCPISAHTVHGCLDCPDDRWICKLTPNDISPIATQTMAEWLATFDGE